MDNMHGGYPYGMDKRILDYSSNVNPLDIPRRVIEAAREALGDASIYPDANSTALKKAIATRDGIDEQYIVCGNGASDIIYRVVYSTKPRKALITSPSFSEYERAINSINCDVVYYDSFENEFIIKEDYLDLIDRELSKGDLIFLCTPNNPTGKLIDCGLLMNILDKCFEKGIYVCLDQTFIDFLSDELRSKYSLINEIKTMKNLVIIRAFTKMYSLAGLRLGYGICYDEVFVSKMNESGPLWNVSCVAEAAGVAACYEDEYPVITRKLIEEERSYLYTELDRLGIDYYESEANFIMFKSVKELKERMLDNGILIRDCSNFRGLDKGYYRIAIRTHEDNLKLIDTLKKVLK